MYHVDRNILLAMVWYVTYALHCLEHNTYNLWGEEEIPGAPEWKGTQTRAVNAGWTELYEE